MQDDRPPCLACPYCGYHFPVKDWRVGPFPCCGCGEIVRIGAEDGKMVVEKG